MPHAPRLRRAALTVLLALSAALLATVYAASPASAAPPTYRVAGDDPTNTGEQWGLHEAYFSELRAILQNTANFGPTGAVRANFTIGSPLARPVTLASLANVDVYFLSARDLVGNEATVLNQYVRNGGTVVVSSNGPDLFDDTNWAGFALTQRNIYGDGGSDTTHKAPQPSAVDAGQTDHPIMNGPFGPVSTFDNWHSVAGFSALPPQAVVLARSPLTFPNGPANPATLAVIPYGALGAGSGAIVATSDVDTFSNAYTVSPDRKSPGDDANTLNQYNGSITGNGVLARNVFGWIAEQKMQLDGVTSGYVSLTSPKRAYDSRGESAFGPGETRTRSLAAAGVPADATMVALNVTAVGPTADGFLTVWPGGGRPEVSNVNFAAGVTVANAAMVKLGANATISMYNSGGSTDVVLDVVGYVASSGSHLVNVTPNRIKDTRSNVGGTGTARGAVTQTLQVTGGSSGVPAGATAVVLNVTSVNTTATAYVTVWPADQSQPDVSNLNTVAGTTVPNLVTVRLPTSGPNAGRINLFNAAGDTDLLVDVLGYYTGGSRSIAADTPHRVYDGRNVSALKPGETRTINTGVTGGATAVIVNVAAVSPTATAYLTVFPGDTNNRPESSNVNFTAGRNTANLVVVHPDGAGNIKIYNPAGDTYVLVDVFGRFDG